MIVKCINHKLSEDQIQLLQDNFPVDQDFHITKSKDYIVFGVSLTTKGQLIYEVLSDNKYLVSIPACLFQIIDSKVSKYWELTIMKDGRIAIWPPEFLEEFYFEDLSEGVNSTVESFDRLKSLIEKETLNNFDKQ